MYINNTYTKDIFICNNNFVRGERESELKKRRWLLYFDSQLFILKNVWICIEWNKNENE
jgi:hypothetical protein